MFKHIIISISAFSLMAACNSNEAQGESQEAKTETKTETKSETKPAAATPDSKPGYSLKRHELGNGVFMLSGSGGNIGLSTGADGAFVIDDQFARYSDVILREINQLSDGPIRFVVNTHYHGDHTGSNKEMHEAGATIVAHDNVRVRMGQSIENLLWGRTVKPTDPGLWPNLTFSETMTFHFNGQTIDVIHAPNAHTDGDAIIYFREADILHMGDNFFNGMFPYIDIDAGGSVDGMIGALETGLMLAGPNTQIIPGHGPMSSKENMATTRDTIAMVQKRVKKQVDAGKSLADIQEADILSDLSDMAGFIDAENMVKIAYRSLTGQLN